MAKKTAKKKKTPRTKTTWNGRTVVLPKGKKKLTDRLKSVINDSITASDWGKAKNTKKCRVVFWTNSRVGVRCTGRNLKAGRKRVGKLVAADLCRKGGQRKTGKQRFRAAQFKKCPPPKG